MCRFKSAPSTQAPLQLDLSDATTGLNKRVRFSEPPHKVTKFHRSEDDEIPWLQPSERAESIQHILQDCRECLRQDSPEVLTEKRRTSSFAAIYEAVYQVCHTLAEASTQVSSSSSVEVEDDLSNMMGPEVIALLAMCRPLARGIEDPIVPRVATVRRVLRRKSIKAIIKVYQLQLKHQHEEVARATIEQVPSRLPLDGPLHEEQDDTMQKQEDADEQLRSLSLSLSRPSRTFARVLGLTDMTAAKAIHSASTSCVDRESKRKCEVETLTESRRVRRRLRCQTGGDSCRAA
jgi:hypothetical protein